MTIPINTNTTIAACIQIQVGDMRCQTAYCVSRMRRGPGRLIPLVALVACLAMCATPLATAAPLGGVNVVGIGPDLNAARIDGAIAWARTLHARIVRTEVPWSTLEPRTQGTIDPHALALTDRLVADASAAGIKVVMTVDSTPCWDSSAPPELLGACTPLRPKQANSWPPRDPAPYGAFTAFLAQRYGSKLAAIEVWNEPDQANEQYLAGPEKPQHYAAILRAAYPAVKQANPAVPVLGGSLVGSNGAFLRALYAAGIKGYYDGLSVHFYNLVLGSLRAIHAVQIANGDDKPLWLDEFGWTSCWPRQRTQQEQGCVTPQIQGANLANVLRSLARTPYVAAEAVYKLQGSLREDFGVLNENGTRKPAFAPLAQALAAPTLGRISPVKLSLRVSRGRVLAAGSGPAGDYLGLEAFQGSKLRYRAVFALDRFNRYSLKLPKVLGTHGLRVRAFQYWAGVSHGAQRSI
jgi:Cellulase (glycosyl hydrolase family 5)